MILKGPLALGALWAGMYATGSVVWAVAGLLFGRLLILLAWDSRLSYTSKAGSVQARMEWNSSVMLRMLRAALPLGVISMLVALSANIPRYFIETRLGTSDLGIYSAIASLLTAGTLVVSAFGQSIMVPAAKACSAGDRAGYRSFVQQTVALGAFLGVGVVFAARWFGRYLLAHLFRPQYAEHSDAFVWLMGAGVFVFVTGGLGYVMTAARALKIQIPLLLCNCAAAAATAAWAIPKHGLRGAAEALLVASLVQLAGSAVILWRIDRKLIARAAPISAPQPVSLEAHV